MKALVLGTTSVQLDLIQKLNKKNITTYGVSYKKEGKAIPYLNYFAEIDIKDKKKVAKYVKTHNIDLVLTVGSDIAMPTIAYVSKKCKLPFFINEEKSILLNNKFLFRNFLKKQNLQTIEFIVGNKIEDFVNWKYFPAIIKPTDSQGQRGIFKIERKEDIIKYFNKSINFSFEKKVIIEQYISGEELSVNCYLYDNEIKYIFISSRETIPGLQGGIIAAHTHPLNISKKLEANIKKLVSETVKALKIENGPAYFQIKHENSIPHIIEATARFDGCHIWKLIKQVHGIDLLDIYISHLTNKKITFKNKKTTIKENTLRFLHQKPQTIFNVDLHKIPINALHSHFYYSKNEKVRSTNGISEKVGYLIY